MNTKKCHNKVEKAQKSARMQNNTKKNILPPVGQVFHYSKCESVQWQVNLMTTKSIKRQKWTPMCHQKYVQKHKKPCSSKCMAQKQNKIRKWSMQRPTKTRCFTFKISCISSIVFLCIHFCVILVTKLLLTCFASSQFEGKALC